MFLFFVIIYKKMTEDQAKSGNQKNTEPQKSAHVLIEEALLDYWDQHKIFEKTLDKTRDNQPYVFFDGPPFATGTPHYGHILASAIKDAVPRYWTMKGRHVRRRWGWDCHGLPIEQLVEVKLGISGKKQIETLGIDKFNEACRANVLGFVNEWGKTVRRIARFVDFENSYKTMDSAYMESVWWTLQQLWNKQLIYEGRKVLLYCPRCETPIANSEVAMDNSYDDETDNSVYVKFQSKTEPETYFLAWTTTPWTLVGNVALAVGAEIDYVKAELQNAPEDLKLNAVKGQTYVWAKDRTEDVWGGELQQNKISGKFGVFEFGDIKLVKGSELAGLEYVPLFEVPELKSDKSFRIYTADFVTTEDGTGIVHTAVVYGEEDYALGVRENLPIVPLVTQQGLYNELTPEFLRGKFIYAEDTDEAIFHFLRGKDAVFKELEYTHSVAFCWRCGTRLFYNAISAWFINIQEVKPRLLELNNQQINWYPGHLKHGRFEKGMAGAPDWNISRNRYWATALPFWKCINKDCSKAVCIGSLAELQEKALNYDEIYKSRKIEEIDLHRPYIDRVELRCEACGGEMQRIEEVIDCWVESGSMPFAEYHYPFENQEEFKKRFPAQFVAEYIPQTRTWFYYMHTISTILFDQAPFENVVTTGNVLAEDGQKMSKSKKNYPDPQLIIDRYGADALRFYLLTAVVMQGQDSNFIEKDLDELYKKLIIVTSNVHSFLRMYSEEQFAEGEAPKSENVLDQWILASLHQLQFEFTKQMDAYDTVRAGRPIIKFVNDLSTWYLRRSRDRIKENNSDSQDALRTLAYVLIELAKVMAPFMPFISEHIYRDLTGKESVHLADWNTAAGYAELSAQESELLNKMAVLREIVELGLSARKEANIKVRQPLAYLAYKFKTSAAAGVEPQSLGAELEKILGQELNVKEIQFAPELAELPDSKFKESADVAVLLGTALTPELREEGLARELERQVQDLRKKFGLKVGELIDLYYETKDAELETALVTRFDRKKTYVMQVKKELEVEPDEEIQVEIESKPIWLGIVKI